MDTTTAPTVVTGDLVGLAEQGIRDLAAAVINGCRNRIDHPTYGYTKTRLRAEAQQMEGAIEMFGLLTGQRAWIGQAGKPAVEFARTDTAEVVAAARHRIAAL